MRSKHAAVVMSTLVFGGLTALTVGAATPASAGDHHRGSQRVSVYNKNFNFSRSDSQQAQREHQRQFDFDRDFRFFNEDNRQKKWQP
jgi:hypothetical protein